MLSFKGLHKSFPFFHEAINELLLLFVFRGKGRTFFKVHLVFRIGNLLA